MYKIYNRKYLQKRQSKKTQGGTMGNVRLGIWWAKIYQESM